MKTALCVLAVWALLSLLVAVPLCYLIHRAKQDDNDEETDV